MRHAPLKYSDPLETLNLPVERERLRPPSDGGPRRAVSLMRKYDVSTLMPDLSIASHQVVAPATPLFENTASAFARGTLISTVRGPMAVEDLLPGDYLETPYGPQAITWIGSTIYVPNTPTSGTEMQSLTRIAVDSFGPGTPMSHILLGPGARLAVRKERIKTLTGSAVVAAPVNDYIDGDRVFEVTPPSSVQLYHIALKEHGTIYAGGLEMETYHPGMNIEDSLGQNMRALFLSLFPNIETFHDFGSLNHPRSTREVIDSLSYS